MITHDHRGAGQSTHSGAPPYTSKIDPIEKPRKRGYAYRQCQVSDGDPSEENRIGEEPRLTFLIEQTSEQPGVEEEVDTNCQQPRNHNRAQPQCPRNLGGQLTHFLEPTTAMPAQSLGRWEREPRRTSRSPRVENP